MPELESDLRRYLDAVTERVDSDALSLHAPRALPARRRRILLPVAAAVVTMVVGAIWVLTDHDNEAHIDTIDRPRPTTEAPSEAWGWVQLPDLIGARDTHAALTWTGTELIGVYPENGGGEVAVQLWNEGLDDARLAAASNLTWRAFPTVVWTGEEVLVLGGTSGPGIDVIGAAYAPSTDSWRRISAPPGFVPDQSMSSLGPDGVWSGSDLIFWREALAYAPETDSWRTITPSPLSSRWGSGVAMISGRVVVWGGCPIAVTDERCQAEGSALDDGAVYDIESDDWEMLSASPLAPGAEVRAAGNDDEVVFATTRHGGGSAGAVSIAAYDPVEGVWRTIDSPPGTYGALVTLAAGARQIALVGGGGPIALLTASTGQWEMIGTPEVGPRGVAVAWIGDDFVVTGGGETHLYRLTG